jgi:hypothetical protein
VGHVRQPQCGTTISGWRVEPWTCFMEVLDTRGPITFNGWTNAAEAPTLHCDLAIPQLDLEAAELFHSKMLDQLHIASHTV